MSTTFRILATAFSLLSLTTSLAGPASALPARASDNWSAVDQRIKPHVYQVNVAVKLKLKDGQWAQLADLSPRRRYPVFVPVAQDQGFRVIGHGTCFPARTARSDRTYLLTNKHVVEFGEGMIQEAQRFFAGMRMYAERSAGFSNPDTRYKDIVRIVSLCTKKNLSDAERQMYNATVDTIWDTYDTHLSKQADPQRVQFNKMSSKVGLQGTVGFFVHAPGTTAQPPMVAELYRQAKNDKDPDLAILTIKKPLTALELDSAPPSEGMQIQAVGYPVTAKPTKGTAPNYSPSFSNGRITRVTPSLVHFDASVNKGDSGGPLVNPRGKVIGVVARKAMPDISTDRYAGAISVAAVKSFAPELFGVSRTRGR